MKLSLAYINDVHGYLEPHPELFYNGRGVYTATCGGYTAISGLIQKIKSESDELLAFDGGDTFHGTLPLIESQGDAVIPVLNHIGFSAMVAHWDFAYGPDKLKELCSRLNYPVLGINVYDQSGKLFFPPYRIIELSGLKIAVIGICCNIVDKTMPPSFRGGLVFTDASEELPTYVGEVKDKGAHIIILLSHNGFPQDVELLQKVPGIDICLSAHTHNRLYEPFYVNETPVIQCGCHGSFLGHIKLNIEGNRIKDLDYALIPVNEHCPQDIVVQHMTAAIMQPYRQLQNEVVSHTSNVMHRYESLSSAMDDFLLAAICEVTGCRIAFSNGWRYGAPIPQGPVTIWDLYNMVPMNPPISTVELTGQELLSMLEENLENTFSSNPLKQMGGYVKRCSGIRLFIKIENPVGSRIQQLFAEDGLVAAESIYKVAFITEQAVPAKFGRNRQKTAVNAVNALKSYCRNHPKLEFGTGLHLVEAI